MEIKVQEVEGAKQKSVREQEAEFVAQAEEKNDGIDKITIKTEEPKEEPTEEPSTELSEDEVVSFLGKRFGREISSLDELNEIREVEKEIPEDVSAYLKYKEETGRGFKDFVALNRDLDSEDPDKILRDYLKATEVGLDDEDIDVLMEDYQYDSDLDEDDVIRRKEISKKKKIAEAKRHFESEKEKYSIPLESSGSALSEEDKKGLESYKQYLQEANSYEEAAKHKQDWFMKQTDKVFGSEFKGFEFAIDDNRKVVFAPGDAGELKKANQDTNAFIQKFLNKDGLLEDSVGYHKAIATAMNSDKIAKYFYELGKSEGIEDYDKSIKNVNMSTRNTPEANPKGGTQIRAVNPDSGNGLKIRSRNKNKN